MINKDYHLLLLDYHLIGIVGLEFMGLKLQLLVVLYWNYIGMECRDMHVDCKPSGKAYMHNYKFDSNGATTIKSRKEEGH